jgi:hypothetical protein
MAIYDDLIQGFLTVFGHSSPTVLRCLKYSTGLVEAVLAVFTRAAASLVEVQAEMPLGEMNHCAFRGVSRKGVHAQEQFSFQK